ncbi:hypothetical protein OV090_17225 [Nannocystis sp. RBIL2]|uniref:hypothetical protein n=1 Tax=Nannocystis sp. RBIL2 TaxID=2996788 RepID=UPI0022712919|nr:hypothetical protein [Nannocystis sp. RBIL2]MCY1066521.1 hypothetical protein [Nannocystis sp. RBIL2]
MRSTNHLAVSLIRGLTVSALALTNWLLAACGDDVKMGSTDDEPAESDTDPCQFSDKPEGIYHFTCENDTDNCWKGHFNEDICGDVQGCELVDPADPTDGWRDVVKSMCTERCIRNSRQLTGHVCENGNWSDVKVTGLVGQECEYQQCSAPSLLLNFDHIEDVLGSAAATDAEDLPCDLWDDCLDYLDPPEVDGMTMSLSTEDARSSADIIMITDPAGGSGLEFLGAGQTTPIPKLLVGEAAYSRTSCGADACPFYLAQYDLEATSPFTIVLSLDGTSTLIKTINDFSISLVRPTLGINLPDSDDLIFPPHSLTFRVTATVSGATNSYGENGSYDFDYSISGHVFGAFGAFGTLTLGTTGESILGDLEIMGVFVEE